MLVLSSTTDVIRVTLDAAVTTNELEFYASFANKTVLQEIFDNNIGLTTGTTAVSIVGSPDPSSQRLIDFISIQNTDTVGATVTVDFYDGTNTRILFKVTLGIDEKLEYEDGKGFSVFANNGAIKTSQNQGSSPISEQTSVTVLESDVVNNTDDSLADVTGLSFSVTSGRVYRFEFVVFFDPEDQAQNQTIKASINGPSEYDFAAAAWGCGNSLADASILAYDEVVQVTYNGTSNTSRAVIMKGIVHASANGTVVARFTGAEVAGNGMSTLTAKEGSYVEYQELIEP